jgi:hypothetical protein
MPMGIDFALEGEGCGFIIYSLVRSFSVTA